MPTQTVTELAEEFLRGDGQHITYQTDDEANAIFYGNSMRMEMRDVKSRIEQFLWLKANVLDVPAMIDDVAPVVFERIKARST